MASTTQAPLALIQNLDLLEQGIRLLEGLDDATYAGSSTTEFSETAGPHLRHCIDAYNCFLDGLSRADIDYDARTRSRDIEVSRDAAVAALRDVHAQLRAIDAPPTTELQVRVDIPGQADNEPSATSTLGREYQFLVSHTVHHYALIAMILRRQDFDPGSDFGVAPSTLRHWHELD